jgi:uncharacterized membrane protein
MEFAQAEVPHSFVLVARRNDSLSPRGRRVVLLSFVAIALVISLASALLGAWLILPFAGAEVIALWVAFHLIARHAGDYESISINGDHVLIEQWVRGKVERHEFSRHWARVVFEPAVPGRGNLLAVRSHGRQVEFGRHLTDEQRRQVAQTLRHELRHIS